MNKITTYNVEAWMLDFHEGRLDSHQEKMLHEFLESHPELSVSGEFDPSMILVPPEIEYPHKPDLYRTDFSIPEMSEEEIECIAMLEGDLFPGEMTNFNESLAANPDKEELFKQLQRTKLKVDERIIFHDKKKLERKIVLIPNYIYGALASAAIVILAWFVFSPGGNNTDPSPVLAQDSIRELIIIDKLAHPSRFDKIAADLPQKSTAKSNLSIEDGIYSSQDAENLRFDAPISKLSPLAMASLSLNNMTDISSSDAFVTRIMPFESSAEYQTFLAYSGDLIRKNILGQDPSLVEKSRFSLWELADVGIEKLANFFSLPMDIEREYNTAGKLVEVSFDSRLVAFSAPVNSKKAQ